MVAGIGVFRNNNAVVVILRFMRAQANIRMRGRRSPYMADGLASAGTGVFGWHSERGAAGIVSVALRTGVDVKFNIANIAFDRSFSPHPSLLPSMGREQYGLYQHNVSNAVSVASLCRPGKGIMARR